MKAQLFNISVLVEFNDNFSPKRDGLIIHINTVHKTWSFSADEKTMYFSKKETDFINNVVEETCAFAAAITKMQ